MEVDLKYVFVFGIIAGIVLGNLIGYLIYGKTKNGERIKQSVPKRNTSDAVKEIQRVLAGRPLAIGFNHLKAIKERKFPEKFLIGDNFSNETPTLRVLVRLCHALGCEVTVKQVGLDDNDPTETKVVSRMREEWYG